MERERERERPLFANLLTSTAVDGVLPSLWIAFRVHSISSDRVHAETPLSFTLKFCKASVFFTRDVRILFSLQATVECVVSIDQGSCECEKQKRMKFIVWTQERTPLFWYEFYGQIIEQSFPLLHKINCLHFWSLTIIMEIWSDIIIK